MTKAKKIIIGIACGIVAAGALAGGGYAMYRHNVNKKASSVPKHVHTEIIDKAVLPTCTLSGLTQGTHCSECNSVLIEQTVIPALGHSFVDGVCSVCGVESAPSNSPIDTGTKADRNVVNPIVCIKNTADGVYETCYDGDLSVFEGFNVFVRSDGYDHSYTSVFVPNQKDKDEPILSNFSITGELQGPGQTCTDTGTLRTQYKEDGGIIFDFKDLSGYSVSIGAAYYDPLDRTYEPARFLFVEGVLSVTNKSVAPDPFIPFDSYTLSENKKELSCKFKYTEDLQYYDIFSFQYVNRNYGIENPLKNGKSVTTMEIYNHCILTFYITKEKCEIKISCTNKTPSDYKLSDGGDYRPGNSFSHGGYYSDTSEFGGIFGLLDSGGADK